MHAFQVPLVPSPFQFSLKQALHDLSGEKIVEFIMNGFQQKIVTERTKEERVERFWRGVTIVAGLSFFLGFVFKNGIVQIQTEDVD
jgi:hypothetical protein